MKRLVDKDLVNQLDYDMSGEVGVCEACIGGKQCKNGFKSSQTVTSVPLELVCVEKWDRSLRRGGVLPDLRGRLYPLHPLKTKDQAFEMFKEWQAEVENFKGLRVKTLRTDNGGSSLPRGSRLISSPVESVMS